MSRMRLGVGAFTLVSVLALSWFLPVLETDSAGAPIPTQQAAQEKQKILKGISAGQVLYLRSIQYERKEPGIPGRAWALPEHVLGEIWMAQDASGAPAIFTTVTRNTEGEVLSYSQLENGHRVSTWVATGDKTSIPMGDEDTLASWVLNVWQTGPRLLDAGYAFVGTGRWYGQPTAIYEDKARGLYQHLQLHRRAERGYGYFIGPDVHQRGIRGQQRARGGQAVTLPERHMVHGRCRSSNADRQFQNSGVPTPARRHPDWPARQMTVDTQVAPRFNESHGLSPGRAHSPPLGCTSAIG